MPSRDCHIRRARKLFRSVLEERSLEELARETQFVRRRRVVTGTSVFWAMVVTLGAYPTRYVSDALRTLNDREGWSLRYKPFWNRLARPAFRQFMQRVFERLCRQLVLRMAKRSLGSVAAEFSDILLDDGSSFAVADGLQKVFPGRFTKIRPAAVELHTHMSLVSDQVLSVALAADKLPERDFLPPPEQLPARSLSLRDRGYIDLDYFAALEGKQTYLICRARSDLNPVVEDVHGVPRSLAKRWRGRRLAQLPKGKLRRGAELIVRWKRRGGQNLRLRLVVRYVAPKQGKRQRVKARRRAQKNAWFLLLTNLPADRFDADTVARLYRLRWQVELLFKEWKSHASLHALQSTDPNIAAGFIWASLCAAFLKRSLAHWAQLVAGRPISNRLAAMSGPHVLPRLAKWANCGFRGNEIEQVLRILLANALPTHPERVKRSPPALLGLHPRTRPPPLASPPRRSRSERLGGEGSRRPHQGPSKPWGGTSNPKPTHRRAA